MEPYLPLAVILGFCILLVLVVYALGVETGRALADKGGRPVPAVRHAPGHACLPHVDCGSA